MTSLFCRHNRFTADCPICSKGTVLDASARGRAPRRAGPAAARRAAGRVARAEAPRAPAAGAPFRGPYAAAGPYEREDGRCEVRLERVPGGLRLAEWSGGAIRRSAPVLPASDLAPLVAAAGERGVLSERDRAALEAALETAGADAAAPGDVAGHGASPGRAGELRDELRVERLGGSHVRIGRWVLRPGRGWTLHEAPPMMPAGRYAQALAEASARGLLAPAPA